MTTPAVERETKTVGDNGCPAYIIFPGRPDKKEYCYLAKDHTFRGQREHIAYLDEEYNDKRPGMKWVGDE